MNLDLIKRFLLACRYVLKIDSSKLYSILIHLRASDFDTGDMKELFENNDQMKDFLNEHFKDFHSTAVDKMKGSPNSEEKGIDEKANDQEKTINQFKDKKILIELAAIENMLATENVDAISVLLSKVEESDISDIELLGHNMSEILKEYNNIDQHKKNYAEVFYTLGNLYKNQQRNDDAFYAFCEGAVCFDKLECLKSALELINPIKNLVTNFEHKTVMLCLIEAGCFLKSREESLSVLKMLSDIVKSDIACRVHDKIGEIYYADSQLEEAKKHYYIAASGGHLPSINFLSSKGCFFLVAKACLQASFLLMETNCDKGPLSDIHAKLFACGFSAISIAVTSIISDWSPEKNAPNFIKCILSLYAKVIAFHYDQVMTNDVYEAITGIISYWQKEERKGISIDINDILILKRSQTIVTAMADFYSHSDKERDQEKACLLLAFIVDSENCKVVLQSLIASQYSSIKEAAEMLKSDMDKQKMMQKHQAARILLSEYLERYQPKLDYEYSTNQHSSSDQRRENIVLSSSLEKREEMCGFLYFLTDDWRRANKDKLFKITNNSAKRIIKEIFQRVKTMKGNVLLGVSYELDYKGENKKIKIDWGVAELLDYYKDNLGKKSESEILDYFIEVAQKRLSSNKINSFFNWVDSNEAVNLYQFISQIQKPEFIFPTRESLGLEKAYALQVALPLNEVPQSTF